MKKPNPKPIRVSKESTILDVSTEYGPDDLRCIADQMEEDGVLAIEIEIEGYEYDLTFIEHRLETDEETAKRYEREKKAYEKYLKAQQESKERRKKRLIKEAKELGLKINEADEQD